MRIRSEIAEKFAPLGALEGRRSFFLVGIGGAGMSAIARMLKVRGYEVRGTDSTRSQATDELSREGIEVAIGHSGDGLRAGDAVVLTDAIDLETSPEVRRARELDLPLFRRSQILGWLLKGHKVIAVTGTHGKTTTTGLIGAGLLEAGLDPLIVVGASVPQWKGPVVEGNGEWAVVEACEAYDSFHDLNPNVVVLTNLEPDHLDYHGTYENLRESVVRFISKAGEDGLLICPALDKGARDVAERVPCKLQTYQASDFPIKLALSGEHNRLNASGALLAAKRAGADLDKAAKGIAEFEGAERRLQILREGEITVVDDYAHHPTEIQKSIQALRERFQGRLVVVFQPHLYSRTKDWIPEFAKELSAADLVVLTDIYPAREAPIPGVSSARIAEQVTAPCRYVPSRRLLARKVADWILPGDVVVGMGAGNISEFAPALVERIDDLARAQRRTRVVVAQGGDSPEREVSLHSGNAVSAALRRKGYDVEVVDVSEALLGGEGLEKFLKWQPDVVFLAVHGSHAEDGAIQGFLELLHVPYTGSGVQASALAIDKDATKRILEGAGLRVPQGVTLTSPHDSVPLEGPLIVKPNSQGSTVGLSFVENPAADLSEAIAKAFAYDHAVLVEEWVKGIEISVPVLGERVLPPVEIEPVSGRYDFESKYTVDATREIVPARIGEAMTARVSEMALKAHRALRCSGATRTDMILRGEEVFVLEVNTLPGMTPTSLLPNSAASVGLEFDDLVEWIVQDAISRSRARS